MEKRVTIRDIAAKAGVSVATAHLALAGKPGPKEETRQQVLEIARALDYQCNSAASSLKRGVTRIAAVLPSLAEENKFYYAPIWQGIRAYCEAAKDFNIELVEIAYTNGGSVSVPKSAVQELRQAGKVSGAIVLGDVEFEARQGLRQLSGEGLPLVLVHGDVPEVGRICCVQAENYLLGRVMGEILLQRTPQGSDLLICAGERGTPANAETTKGLEDYLDEHDPKRLLYQFYSGYDDGNMAWLHQQLLKCFCSGADIAGCCSVTARGSVQLAKVLAETGRAGRLPAIGSDMFPDNIAALEQGVFQNLIFKNPYQQGWLAAEQLFKHIFRAQPTEGDVILVKGEVVFQSTISMYEARPRKSN